jgi:flagellar hook protein FlgE
MMRSLFAGVSGLRSHQTMMDVIGNNVANVNTIGFKSSRVVFADALSQLIRGASSGTGEATGGVTPQQVGLGTKIAATDIQWSQGGTQLTGNATDVSLQGDGMFGVRLGTETLYTRAGAFHFDNQGFLVDPTGGVVQGWRADNTGAIDRSVPVGDIRIPIGQTIDPVPTTSMTIRGNLSATATVDDPPRTTVIDVVDSQGIAQRITANFTKTADNSWQLEVLDPEGTSLGTTDLEFDPATGLLTSPTDPPEFSFTPPAGAEMTFTIDLGTAGGAHITQFGATTDVQATSQNGSTSGVLRSFAIGADGTVSGVYSNGSSKSLGQLAIAAFADPKGLIAASDNRFRTSTASGGAIIGTAGEAGRGSINAGTLEMSNVELSQEFTNLILAQRGFQASSRIITTSDEMIQDLVNLKR